MADLYASMTEMKQNTVEGVDWQIVTRTYDTDVLVSGIHGGGIEIGVSELSTLIAEIGSYNYFAFEGLRSANNGDLHVTSTHYDEPTMVKMVTNAMNHVAVHGASGDTEIINVGGLDIPLRNAVWSELTKRGFNAVIAPSNIIGEEPDNVSNRTLKGGCVQLELTSQQRKAFFTNYDWSKTNRTDRKNWTQKIYDFAEAVYTAVEEYKKLRFDTDTQTTYNMDFKGNLGFGRGEQYNLKELAKSEVSAEYNLSIVNDMSNDSKLTPLEKRNLKIQFDNIIKEKAQNDTLATTYGITTEKTNYGNSYTTLYNYVNPLLSNLTTTSSINGTTMRNYFADYYDKLAILSKVISTKAKTLADGAQTTANTANTNAGNAQTSANTAQSMAIDAKNTIAGSMIKNPLFLDWTGAVPAGTGYWSTTNSTNVKKENTLSRTGGNAVRMIATGTEDVGLNLNGSFYIPNVANVKYLVVEIDFMLVSGTLSGAGLLVDWTGMNPYRVTLGLDKEITSPDLNKWYTVRKLIVRPTDTLTGWTNMAGYLMGNYPSISAKVAKDIIYDRVHIREATSEEIKAYQSDLMIADMSSDSKITPVEKVQLKKEWATISAEKPSYETLANTYGVTTEKTNFVNAYNTLNTTLNGSSGVLVNMQTTSSVTASTFRAQFDDYYDKKAILNRVINEKARSLANTAQSTIDGLEIGGANIVNNTRFLRDLSGWKAYGSATITTFSPAGTVSKQNGIRVYAPTATTSSIGVQTPTFPIQANKTYVCSFIARSAYSFETSFDYIYLRSGQGTTIKKLPDFVKNDFPVYDQNDNISRRVSFTFSHNADVADANLLIGIVGTGVDGQGFVIRELQVELGTKPTSWSPSPLEVTGYIEEVEATANKAKGDIADMSSDSKVTPLEKVQLKKEWATIQAEKPTLYNMGTTFGKTAERDAFNTSYNNLNTDMTSILSNMSTTTSINSTTFRAKFDDYYDKKALLIKATSEDAKSRADGAQSTANTANTTANTVTKTVDDNKTVWNRASNFRSDGNLDPDKIYGTIPDAKISGATNWNDAKTKIDLWKYNGDATKINGGNIATGTIFAKSMLMSDFTNLCENPDFELDTPNSNPMGFTGGTNYRVVDISAYTYGNGSNRAFQIDAMATQSSSAYMDTLIPVSAGQQFYVGAEGRYYNTNGDGYGRIGFKTYDAKKSSDNHWYTAVAWTGTKDQNFGYKSGTFVVPDGVKYIQIWISFSSNTTANNSFIVDNIRIHRMANAELIVDGTIEAKHIKSLNGITVGNGQFKVDANGNVTLGAGAVLTAVRLESARGNTFYLGDDGSKIDYSIAGTIKRTRYATNDLTYLAIDDTPTFNFVMDGSFDVTLKKYGSHYGLKLGSPIVKGLLGEDVVQIRNWNDTDYAGLSAKNITATGDLSVWGNQSLQGVTTISGSAGGMLKMVGTADAYIEMFPDGTGAGRKSFFGHENATGNNFVIQSDANEVILKTNASRLKVDDGTAGIHATNANDNAYIPIYASEFKVSSRREWKKNIEPLYKSALKEILDTPVYQYHLNSDNDNEMKRTGFILEEAPMDMIDAQGIGLDLYAGLAYAFKAIQELSAKVDYLENKLRKR